MNTDDMTRREMPGCRRTVRRPGLRMPRRLLGLLLFLLATTATESFAAGMCDATRVQQPTLEDDMHRTFVSMFRDENDLGELTDPSRTKGGNVVSVFLKKDGEIKSLFFAASKAGAPVDYSIGSTVIPTTLNQQEIVELFRNLDAINTIEAANAGYHSEGNAFRIIRSHIAETQDFASQYDEVSMYSERIPCSSCENVLNEMRKEIVELPGGSETSFRLSFDYNSQSDFKDLHTWNWDTAYQSWIGN